MRHICSGEDICGMVKKDERGVVLSVSDHMNICAERTSWRGVHCGLIRSIVYFQHGTPTAKQKKAEPSMYQLRMMPLFKDETKAEFLGRMRRAQSGPWERKPYC